MSRGRYRSHRITPIVYAASDGDHTVGYTMISEWGYTDINGRYVHGRRSSYASHRSPAVRYARKYKVPVPLPEDQLIAQAKSEDKGVWLK